MSNEDWAEYLISYFQELGAKFNQGLSAIKGENTFR